MPTTVPIAPAREPGLWTAEGFLEWLKPGVHADLIDGERFMHSPVSLRHANLLNFVDHLLRGYLESRKLGVLYREVVAVRLSARNVFLPDLAYFTREQAAQLAPTYAPMAPTFVLEARSPGTEDRDLGPKFAEYEVHGVQEYWVLDPQTLDHRFFRLEGEILAEFGQGADLVSARAIPGFWVRRAWLNPDALPEVAPSLAEILAAK